MDAEIIVMLIGGVITGANAITAMTPTRVDNVILDKVLRVLNLLSLNVGKNRNADDE